MPSHDQIFPPKPTFEVEDVPNLHGKIYIVTGASGGIGYELVKMLYSKNATIYIAARNQEAGESAISTVKSEYPSSEGKLAFLRLDLADLSSIKASANSFPEEQLHGIVHNAGVMIPPYGSKTPQGWELQFGTNVLGPFVFQRHLTDKLLRTASGPPAEPVRVLWASSAGHEFSPPSGVSYANIDKDGMSSMGSLQFTDRVNKYAQSKAANNLLAGAMAQKYKGQGIISLSFNPGNLKSPLWRHTPWYLKPYAAFLCHPPRFGGLTELSALLNPVFNDEKLNGSFVIPWGRPGVARKDVEAHIQDGGALKFWEWCEEKTKEY